MAVNEATTNAVRHGDGRCAARIWQDDRGLWLINQVCDLVEMRCHEQGMTLRLHMHDAVA